jgi:apolipoprotein N-acyltransferase
VIRLVQPNAEQHLKWDPERARFYFNRLLELSAMPSEAKTRPELVIWPETSVPYLLNRAGGALGDIAAASLGAVTVVGIQRTEDDRGWNSMAVIAPDGQVGEVYDKHHLVPFGEYIPFGDLAYSLFGVQAFAAQVGNGYSAGSGAAVLDLGPRFGLALPLICYEAVFPQDLRAAPGRARFILQITNDAWFGTLTGPFQHLAQARLRAIEQGLPLVRSANTGVSAVVDARGRIIAELPLGVAAFLDAALPVALPPTPYARFGEAPFLVLWFALAFGLVCWRMRWHP